MLTVHLRSSCAVTFRRSVLAALYVSTLTGCIPTPVPDPTAHRLRVLTYNTQAIVPEMDLETGVMDKIIEYGGDVIGALALCEQTLTELGTDAISGFGLLDERGESKDRTLNRVDSIISVIQNRQSDFDIIALNEVFLEEARDEFVNGLSGYFPYYVEKAEGATPCTEDSGLMLFSRWPLELLQLLPAPVDHRFVEFDPCDCEDCFAEKGVLYARIRNAVSGDVYHVAVAHLQADAEFCPLATSISEHYNTRSEQLADVRDALIDGISAAGQMLAGGIYSGDTNVLFIGDLNVVGTQPAALQAIGDTTDNIEWFLKFDPPTGGYFAGTRTPSAASPLCDAWAQTTSPLDPGATNFGAKRLDYIFFNSSPGPLERRLVPHHLTLQFDDSMSDHAGVHAVINRWQQYCMPAEALAPQAGYTLPGGDTGGSNPNQTNFGVWPNNTFHDLEVTVPGGYLWVRLDLPGTYSLSIANRDDLTKQNESSGFSLRVFVATDLTNDVANYYGQETNIKEYFPDPGPSLVALPEHPPAIVAKKFLLPEAPFYLLIAPTAANGIGRVRLYTHRHEGRTKHDAISLPTCCTLDYFHGLAILNAEDMPWFEVSLERPSNPAAHQTARFIVIAEKPPAIGSEVWNLRLQDENDAIIAQSTEVKTSSLTVNDNDPAYGTVTLVRYVDLTHDTLEDVSTAPNPKYYLRVGRPGLLINGNLSTVHDRYKLRWETNLTVLHGKRWAGTHAMRIRAGDETCIDAGGSDEIGIQIRADGLTVYDLTDSMIGGNATDMDSGDTVSLEPLIEAVRYVESLEFRLLEFDPPEGPDLSSWKSIPPLPPNKAKAWKGSFGLTLPCNSVGDDGDYEYYYNRSRSLYYLPCD